MTGSTYRRSGARPKVAMLIPASRQDQVLTPSAIAHLHRIADIVGGDQEAPEIQKSLGSLLADADVALTGWGTPPLSDAALDGAPRLRLIAHTAGSVKNLLPARVFDREIVVCHASNILADAVSEYTVLVILLGLRRVHEMDRALKNGVAWRDAAPQPTWLLGARTVGLVSAGYSGRKVIHLLRAFDTRILLYDPYLSADGASNLGVELVTLETIFRESDVVSIHAPITPETRHLIGKRELDLLRDGALFVNCARAWVVDQAALLAKLREGRVWAALDVFDEEPLPIDHPLRSLANAFLTPHRAGHTLDSEHRQGDVIVEEIERYLAGRELIYRISPGAYALMA